MPLDGGGFDLDGERFDKVIVATGGSPKQEGLAWLEALGHTIVNPVPSLFTFNMPGESVTDLMGVVVPGGPRPHPRHQAGAGRCRPRSPTGA